MSTAPTVQAYMNASLSGGNEWCGAIDSGRDRIFSTGPADAQTYLTEYGFDSGSVENFTNNTPALGASIQFQSAMTVDPSGNVWTFDNNLQRIVQLIPGSPWTIGVTGGASGLSGWSASSFAWTVSGGNNYLFGSGFARPGADARDICAFAISGSVLTANGTFQNSGGTTSIVAGPPGTAYWTVQPFGIFGTAFGLGKCLISGASIVGQTIKNYVPTDFDPLWTGGGSASIQSFSGLAYDQTDGNVIIFVTGQGNSGANFASYIAKLSTSDGSVLWKVAADDNHGFSDQGILPSVIKNGTFIYFANSTQHVQVIDTSDGTTTNSFTSTGGVIALSNQSSNDVFGGVVGNGTWNSADGAITLLNGSPDNSSSLAAIGFIPPQPSGGGSTSYFDVWGS